MKKLLLLTFFISAFAIVKSQSLIFFEDDHYGYGIEKNSDGNLIAIFDGQLRKLDVLGNIMWQVDIALPYSLRDIEFYNLPDGDIIFFYGSNICRYTLEGDLVFSIPITDFTFSAIHQVSDGFQIVCDSWDTPTFRYLKILNNGEITWNHVLDFGGRIAFGSMISQGSKTLLIYTGAAGAYNPTIVQLDTAGTIDFISHDFDDHHFDVEDLDNELFLSRQDIDGNYLQKYSDNEIPDWETVSYGNGYLSTDSLFRIIKLPSNNYVRAIESEAFNVDMGLMESFYYLEYFNEAGENFYIGEPFLKTGNDKYHIYDFAQIEDNKLAFIGNYENAGNSTAFILITDTLGVVHQMNVEGKVFYDENSNNIFDAGEISFPNIFIETDPGAIFSLTNSEGDYSSTLVSDGIYSNSCLPIPYWDVFTPSEYVFELNAITGGTTVDNNDYHLSYSSAATEVGVSLYQSGIALTTDGAEPALNTTDITVNNFGNQVVEELTLKLYHPMVNSLISSSPLYESHFDTIITWTIYDLKPYQPQVFHLVFEADSSIDFVGKTAAVKAELGSIAGDIDATNNMDIYSNVLDYSFDPNQLTVKPVGLGVEGNISPAVEWLEYQIEFENTGTGYAHDVIVVDTIENDLVLSSIQMLAASHQYWMEFISPNIIKWHFNDIELTPPAYDIIKSKGYLKYKINIKGHPPVGTKITNTASIFFDKNLPIVTNTTINTIYLDLPVVTEIDPIYIFPNPTTDHFTIYFNNATGPFDIVSIADVTGKIISNFKVEENVYSMNLNTSVFAKGIYFIYYYNTEQKNLVAAEKLIINN